MTDATALAQSLRRWMLWLGVLQILVGCLVGLVPPSAVAWFRGIVMAHIEFTVNGILMVAFGFLVPELRLKAGLLKAWFVTLQLGTWANGGAGVAAAILGRSSPLMPTINEKFPAPLGTDSALVSGMLQACGLAVIAALVLTLIGLSSRRSGNVG